MLFFASCLCIVGVLSSSDQLDAYAIIADGYSLAQSSGLEVYHAYDSDRLAHFLENRSRAVRKAVELGLEEDLSSLAVLEGERANNLMMVVSMGTLSRMAESFAEAFSKSYKTSLERRLLPVPEPAKLPAVYRYGAPVEPTYPDEVLAEAAKVSDEAAAQAEPVSLMIARAYHSDTSYFVEPKRQLAREAAERGGLNIRATSAGITRAEKSVGILIAIPGNRLNEIDEVFASGFVDGYRADVKKQALEGVYPLM